MDEHLTPDERALAEVAQHLGSIVDSNTEACWVEDIIPPMSEDDVLTSCLYTRPGAMEPKSGFTLWTPDGIPYKVMIEKLEKERMSDISLFRDMLKRAHYSISSDKTISVKEEPYGRGYVKLSVHTGPDDARTVFFFDHAGSLRTIEVRES